MNLANFRKSALSLGIVAAGSLLLAELALAQDVTDLGIEEMVVTAQKREENVQAVPISISTLSATDIERRGLQNTQDLIGTIPNMGGFQPPGAKGNLAISLRGVSSGSPSNLSIDTAIGVYVDGFLLGKQVGSSLDVAELERVEVLRGPQGTLFGRGAQIGAVHLIQNKAVNASEGAFRAGFGTYGETYFNGFVNAPLAEDKLYGRLAVFHQQRDGYVDNLAGGDLNGKDTFAVRGSLRLDLGEASGLDLIVNHQKDTPPGTAFRSTGYYTPVRPRIFIAPLPTRGGSTDVFDRTADLNRGDDLGLDRTVTGVSLLGQFWLSDDWSLSTITGWREFDSHEEFDGDGSQLSLIESAEIAEGRQFSQEVRFNFDAGGAFRGFVGGSWFSESGSQQVPIRTDERSLYALLSPVLAPQINQAICVGNGGSWGSAGCNIPTPPLPQVPVLYPLNPDGTPNTGFSLGGLPGLPNPGVPGLPAFFPLNPNHVEQYTNYGEVEAIELFADGTWSVN